jgi:hypothetical protein
MNVLVKPIAKKYFKDFILASTKRFEGVREW